MTNEYIWLDICERWKINPVEFDNIPDEIKIMMRAKRDLDLELKDRQNKDIEGKK